MGIKDVYDAEREKIHEIGIELQRSWVKTASSIDITNQKDTAKKLNEWAKQVKGAYEKIGFIAETDVTPIYGDHPPTITILDRVNSQTFDHEKKAHEVQKERR